MSTVMLTREQPYLRRLACIANNGFVQLTWNTERQTVFSAKWISERDRISCPVLYNELAGRPSLFRKMTPAFVAFGAVYQRFLS